MLTRQPGQVWQTQDSDRFWDARACSLGVVPRHLSSLTGCSGARKNSRGFLIRVAGTPSHQPFPKRSRCPSQWLFGKKVPPVLSDWGISRLGRAGACHNTLMRSDLQQQLYRGSCVLTPQGSVTFSPPLDPTYAPPVLFALQQQFSTQPELLPPDMFWQALEASFFGESGLEGHLEQVLYAVVACLFKQATGERQAYLYAHDLLAADLGRGLRGLDQFSTEDEPAPELAQHVAALHASVQTVTEAPEAAHSLMSRPTLFPHGPALLAQQLWLNLSTDQIPAFYCDAATCDVLEASILPQVRLPEHGAQQWHEFDVGSQRLGVHTRVTTISDPSLPADSSLHDQLPAETGQLIIRGVMRQIGTQPPEVLGVTYSSVVRLQSRSLYEERHELGTLRSPEDSSPETLDDHKALLGLAALLGQNHAAFLDSLDSGVSTLPDPYPLVQTRRLITPDWRDYTVHVLRPVTR